MQNVMLWEPCQLRTSSGIWMTARRVGRVIPTPIIQKTHCCRMIQWAFSHSHQIRLIMGSVWNAAWGVIYVQRTLIWTWVSAGNLMYIVRYQWWLCYIIIWEGILNRIDFLFRKLDNLLLFHLVITLCVVVGVVDDVVFQKSIVKVLLCMHHSVCINAKIAC